MSDSFIVHIDLPGGSAVPVTVTRKRVKNLNLRIDAKGEVRASVPVRVSKERIERFLAKHAAWIEERLQRAHDRQASMQSAGAHTLDTVPLWGRMVAGECIDRAWATFTAEERQARLQEYYRAEVTRALPGVVEPLEEAMQVKATRWAVRSMKTRWGSCTPRTARIRIALQLAAYPPACLTMVVAHELVHLMEPSHNQRFHMLLDAYCPCNRELARRLRKPPVDTGL